MSVRIGMIELPGVQNLYTEEARTLVEQKVPDQQGSVFQDLGRNPVTIVVEGLLYGEAATTALEELRQSQANVEPLPFSADIAVGTELTDIIIEDINIRQLAGYKNRYRFSIRLREYLEAPQTVDADIAAVDAGIEADAKSWSADSLGAVAALQDPTTLADTLTTNPGALEHLDVGDLGSAISDNVLSIGGADFSKLVSTLKNVDPKMVLDLIQSVRDADSLGDFLSKYADEGLSLIEDLTGVDLGLAESLINAFSGALEFLEKLKEVGDRAGDLVDNLSEFDSLSGLKPILER